MSIKNLIVFNIALIFISCNKIINDTNKECTLNCATIKGKFITLDNVPVPNVRIELDYRISGGELGGGSTRKIVNIQTGQNGEYAKNFYIIDSELGNVSRGYFRVKINDSKLDPDIYIKSNNKYNSTQELGYPIYSITARDTVIDNTFYIPKKAFIKVNLNNFIPRQTGDYFEVQTLYPFGREIGNNTFLNSKYSTGFSGYGIFRAYGLNSLLNVFVAEGERNIIRISKRKGGINSYQDSAVNIPPNNTIELTYNY